MLNSISFNKSMFGMVADLLQFEGVRNIPNLTDIVKQFVKTCFTMFEGVESVSVVKMLGEGSYNIIFEVAIETSEDVLIRALRLNKAGERIKYFKVEKDLMPDAKTGQVDQTSQYGAPHIPKIDASDVGWLLTHKYYNFERIWSKLINLKMEYEKIGNMDALEKTKDVLHWLVQRYALEGLDIIRYVHMKGLGVFDWKLDNFCIDFVQHEDGPETFRMIYCDLDFSWLSNPKICHTHAITNFHAMNADLDYLILIKDIYSLVMTIERKGNEYSKLVEESRTINYYLRDLMKLNKFVNKFINRILNDLSPKCLENVSIKCLICPSDKSVSVDQKDKYVQAVKELAKEVDADLFQKSEEQMDANIFGNQLQKNVFGWCKKLIEVAKARTEGEK